MHQRIGRISLISNGLLSSHSLSSCLPHSSRLGSIDSIRLIDSKRRRGAVGVSGRLQRQQLADGAADALEHMHRNSYVQLHSLTSDCGLKKKRKKQTKQVSTGRDGLPLTAIAVGNRVAVTSDEPLLCCLDPGTNRGPSRGVRRSGVRACSSALCRCSFQRRHGLCARHSGPVRSPTESSDEFADQLWLRLLSCTEAVSVSGRVGVDPLRRRDQ